MTGFIVTANRLRDGEVVYRTADGTWSEDLRDALVLDNKQHGQEFLATVATPGEELVVVDPYLAKAESRDGVAQAIGQRESIRAKGPTVHPQFGKQARTGAAHV